MITNKTCRDVLAEKEEDGTTIAIVKVIVLRSTMEAAVEVGVGVAVPVEAAHPIMEHLQAAPSFWKAYR
jgi:hypothetical protein